MGVFSLISLFPIFELAIYLRESWGGSRVSCMTRFASVISKGFALFGARLPNFPGSIPEI